MSGIRVGGDRFCGGSRDGPGSAATDGTQPTIAVPIRCREGRLTPTLAIPRASPTPERTYGPPRLQVEFYGVLISLRQRIRSHEQAHGQDGHPRIWSLNKLDGIHVPFTASGFPNADRLSGHLSILPANNVSLCTNMHGGRLCRDWVVALESRFLAKGCPGNARQLVGQCDDDRIAVNTALDHALQPASQWSFALRQ